MVIRATVCGLWFALAAGLVVWMVATDPIPLILLPLPAGIFVVAVALSLWQFHEAASYYKST